MYHLSNITIELNTAKRQHLLLTGKNGSGKTSLLLRLVEYLKILKIESLITAMENYQRLAKVVREKGTNALNENDRLEVEKEYKRCSEMIRKYGDGVRVSWNDYQEAENQEEKEDIAMLLKRELKDSSAFTAFKRWLIWDNEEKYGELEKFIPENQKKKLFDI